MSLIRFGFDRCGLAAVVIAALFVGAAAPGARGDDDNVARARVLTEKLSSGDYEGFIALGSDTIKQQFGVDKARAMWGQLTMQLGPFERVVSAEPVAGQPSAVRVTMAFEQGTLKLRYVFNEAGQMAGLWIDKLDRPVAYTPPDYVHPDSFREEEVQIGPADAPLPGTLTLPIDRSLHPGVVLVHGSGPHDQDETVGGSKPFRDLAWGLASKGIAVLRYEKRTKKYPAAKPVGEITLEYETIDDAVAAAELLRKRPDIDPKQVYVLGHSLGAQAAPFIALRDKNLAGIILIGAPARPMTDVVEDQLHYLEPIQNPDGKADAVFQKAYEAIKAIRAGKTERVDLLGAPAAYWAELNKRLAPDAAAKTTCPVLVIHGGRDYQVTDKDFDLWKQRFSGDKRFTLRRYDKLNHLMIAGSGPSTPAEYKQPGHVDKVVIDDIAGWIRGRGAIGR